MVHTTGTFGTSGGGRLVHQKGQIVHRKETFSTSIKKIACQVPKFKIGFKTQFIGFFVSI